MMRILAAHGIVLMITIAAAKKGVPIKASPIGQEMAIPVQYDIEKYLTNI